MKFTLVSLLFVALHLAQPTTNTLDKATAKCLSAGNKCNSTEECCDRKCVPQGFLYRCVGPKI
ncbi:hypothetical protein CONCODRAFT_20034 [Conidiobolus coronatus NRRL 28638]|uniref:Uncharacterized protein n=1 Tax=Conidiobolus coronatus (strain ATCC 28846 / CBS 209.66 / NRRL 28638) TaxID=796925 RepID=A0A137NVG8_CONC2|nr:hypothetical protein CONCODRAFT_20034 [Conidiobolus coronatus NRRL 28638]|eukprot:KXN66810.1 hypothetical protein CONCODRAFT_20034 [Conidiobolus coronatus NRRL 28638]